jgi:vacuolar-type H+-ATPase subunit I/STV1
MPLLKGSHWRVAPAAASPPPEPSRPAPEPDSIVRREIDLLRQQIETAEIAISKKESSMADNNDNASLTSEERAVIKRFRESHLSAAEQKAKFEAIYRKPVSEWTTADYDAMTGWLPMLLKGELPGG